MNPSILLHVETVKDSVKPVGPRLKFLKGLRVLQPDEQAEVSILSNFTHIVHKPLHAIKGTVTLTVKHLIRDIQGDFYG